MKYTIALIGFMLLAPLAHAQSPRTAQELQTDCESTVRFINDLAAGGTGEQSHADDVRSGSCVGYMLGFMDGLEGMSYIDGNDIVSFSTPDGFTGGQLAQVYAKYMAAHPEFLQKRASYAATRAFLEYGILVLKNTGKTANTANSKMTF